MHKQNREIRASRPEKRRDMNESKKSEKKDLAHTPRYNDTHKEKGTSMTLHSPKSSLTKKIRER